MDLGFGCHSRLLSFVQLSIACVAGVRREGKGDRRAREAREDRTWTWEDSPSLDHFDFLSIIVWPAMQAKLSISHGPKFQVFINSVSDLHSRSNLEKCLCRQNQFLVRERALSQPLPSDR